MYDHEVRPDLPVIRFYDVLTITVMAFPGETYRSRFYKELPDNAPLTGKSTIRCRRN